MLNSRDEISEGVALDEHFAGIVPWLAQIAAAADMSIGHDYAAIEQAEAVRTESERQRVTVRAVAIDVEGIGAAFSLVLAIDERDGNLDAIRSDGVHALTGIESAVE